MRAVRSRVLEIFTRPDPDVTRQIADAALRGEGLWWPTGHIRTDPLHQLLAKLLVHVRGSAEQAVTRDRIREAAVCGDDLLESHARMVGAGHGMPATVIPLGEALGLYHRG